MALIGLPVLGLGAIVADLRGNDTTRWFTRRVFGIVALIEMGLTTSGIASFAGDLLAGVL